MTAARLAASRRRGASLIEIVMIVGTMSVILGLCGTLLHLLMRLDHAGRGAMADAGTVGRLARQLRLDVRAADSAKVAASGKAEAGGLDLTGSGRPAVSYRFEPGRVARVETEGQTVRRRESYVLAQLGTAAFHVDGGRVSLDLPRPDDAAGPASRPGYRVEARLGKDRRLAREKEAPR